MYYPGTTSLLASLAAIPIRQTAASSVITHQGNITAEHALSEWLTLVAPTNATDVTARSVAAQMTPWDPSSANLFKRQRNEDENGALLCTDGPCVDHSCCGPQGICGYGPDFCGDGCQSDCDAVAMCGKFSEGGDISCGLDLCCSWGGWCGTADVHCIGPNEWALCQEGYGKCEIIRPQSCGEGSGTAEGRMIGYYQASNVRNRVCNRISPSSIKTDGYTHLFFAFASVDPSTYKVKPWVEDDIPTMKEFTQLKGKGRDLQTWIAVGGWEFSEPSQPTHTTWHDICADSSKRATFIASLIDFMDEYGFQGADIDWEYPGSEDRGGNRDDIANFVLLIKEMREAFGSNYGISLTLAPDYWYLRYFDVAGLGPYVDHMGFMAYDLHGFWDSDVEALGSIVRGQANIAEIANNTIPLAYAGVDPSKITLGVAWYGRGYTLADPSCNTLGCPFSGPSEPGKCTNSAGVLSLVEIKDMIDSGAAQSNMLDSIGMKELVWDNQWIGYDDEETVELKRKFANDRCYGGLMAWSVDFNSGSGDGTEPPKSTDGQCGPNNGGAVCPGSGFGDCCSSSGWCGSTEAHCGSGCISGECEEGGETTDGRCGAGFNDFVCGDWPQGSCCSSSGYCGSSDAHCGDGCQSGCNGDGGDNTGGEHDPYVPDEDDDTPLEPCPYSPTTLEEMNNLDYNSELPAHCVPEYLIQVFNSMLVELSDRYEDILADGYDGYFGTYADYVVRNSQLVLHQYMSDHGNDYFTCKIWQEYACCTSCDFLHVSCQGCWEGDDCSIESSTDDGIEWDLRDQPCPPDMSERGIGDWGDQSIFWSLKSEVPAEDFFAEASIEVGAPIEKFSFTDHVQVPGFSISTSCARDYAFNGFDDMSEACKYEGYWRDAPIVNDFETGDVVNPKDTVKKSIEDAKGMLQPLSQFSLAIAAGSYAEDPYDLVDAVSLPILMLEQSIEYMKVVADMGKEIEEALQTEFILNLLSAIFFVLGFSGTLASLGLRSLGRVLVAISEAGNAGLGINTVISTPESAPLLIFGLVMGAFNIRDAGKVGKAAQIRRTMQYQDFADFSTDVARTMDDIAAWNKKPAYDAMCRYA